MVTEQAKNLRILVGWNTKETNKQKERLSAVAYEQVLPGAPFAPRPQGALELPPRLMLYNWKASSIIKECNITGWRIIP